MIDSERLVKNFCAYARIDSESFDEGPMEERLVADLKDLGCEVRTDGAGAKAGSTGNNIYAFYKGTLPGEPLIYSCHMDTVKPGKGVVPVVKDGVISSGGDTILAADDKSGIAGIVEALAVVREKGLPCHDFEIIVTIGEEQGLLGAKHFDFSRVKGREAVVLDGAGDVGTIVPNAPGQIKMHAVVTGRSAHAGLAPEKGVSAIQAAARGVAAMNLLRIDEETTCNIGTFKSESATNIVPARAEIVAEIRSRNLDKLNAQAAHMRDCLQKACDELGATLDCELKTTYVSFACPDDHPLMKRLRAACGAIGCSVRRVDGGGGSDANVMALAGITPVVLGTGMKDVHTVNETITVKNLEDTARLVLRLMTD